MPKRTSIPLHLVIYSSALDTHQVIDPRRIHEPSLIRPELGRNEGGRDCRGFHKCLIPGRGSQLPLKRTQTWAANLATGTGGFADVWAACYGTEHPPRTPACEAGFGLPLGFLSFGSNKTTMVAEDVSPGWAANWRADLQSKSLVLPDRGGALINRSSNTTRILSHWGGTKKQRLKPLKNYEPHSQQAKENRNKS